MAVRDTLSFCLRILEGDDINVVVTQRQAEKIYLFGLPGKPSLITVWGFFYSFCLPHLY